MAPTPTPDGIRVNTLTLAFTLIAGTVVFLRLFTRFVLTKGAGIEDACIAIAMLLSIGLAVVTSEQVMHGLGTHADMLNAEDIEIIVKNLWASLWIYNLTLTVTKVSTLVQYLKIFPIPRFQYACYVLLCIVLTCGAWGVLGNVFMCYPVAFFWDKAVGGGRCMNQYIIWFTTAGFNIAQDVVILLLPVPVIRILQIPASQKKGLVTMLALGASVVVVSIIRLYTLNQLANSTDISYHNSDQATMSAVEANVGIICACLPAMRPLFAVMMPKYFSTKIQCTKEPIKDAERANHIEHKRTPSGNKMQPHQFSSRHPYMQHGDVKGSLSSKASLHSRPTTAAGLKSSKASIYSRPSTAGGPNNNSPSLSSPAPAFTRDRRVSVSSRLQTNVPVNPPNSRSGSANHSRSNSANHIAMVSINYPGKGLSHSRSASNLSVSTSRPHGPFMGNLNPLRMSPVTPFGPPMSQRLSRLPETEMALSPPLPPLSPPLSRLARRQSDASHCIKRLSSWRRAATKSVVGKPLPLTPFPVGSEKYSHLADEAGSG